VGAQPENHETQLGWRTPPLAAEAEVVMAEQKRLSIDESNDLAKDMAKELMDVRAGIETYDDYYNGEQAPISYNDRISAAYAQLLEMSVSNWCRLIVDVVSERLVVGAIRSSQDQAFDTDAWAYWQANNLDAAQQAIHTEALKSGLSYVAVWPRDNMPARIVGESPQQVHVRYDEVTGEPLYGVKVWEGRTDRYLYCTLYDSEAVYRFRSESAGDALETYTARAPQTFDLSSLSLEPRPPDDDGGPELDNPLGRVPFVLFPTEPDLLGGYTSELQGVITIQDRINKTTADRMMTQEFHAFPQRWVTGIDVPVNPDTGQPKEPFDSALDKLWTATSPETHFGQFMAHDSGNFLRAIEADIQSMSTQSRTPPHYLMAGMGQFPSGESVRATEYGLSRKVQARQDTYGEAWEEVIRLAALASGNATLAEDTALHVEWKDVEARSEGEIVDALLKMSTLGVPRQVLWERWGVSPQEAERWEEAAAKELEDQATAGLGLAIGQGTSVVPTTPAPGAPPLPGV
jgi:hypothetical protein